MTPVCSISFSVTVIPSKSAASISSLEFTLNAISPILFASSIKESFFVTKSVSQLSDTTTPRVLSALIFAITTPSEESLSALFSATFCPFLRSTVIASSKLPSASTRAFLQSIIPAPVASLNFFTSAAVMFAMIYKVLKLKKVVYSFSTKKRSRRLLSIIK